MWSRNDDQKCWTTRETFHRNGSDVDYEKAVNVISLDSHAHKYGERNQLSATMWKILRWDEQLRKGFLSSLFARVGGEGREEAAFRLIKLFFPPNKWRNWKEFQATAYEKGQLLKRMRSTFSVLETNSSPSAAIVRRIVRATTVVSFPSNVLNNRELLYTALLIAGTVYR